jgi:uncharacterized cupin superfamily protein
LERPKKTALSAATKEKANLREIREELTGLEKRHPYGVEILHVAPGKTPYVYHSHSAQSEFDLRSPSRQVIRSGPPDYFDGEE